MKPRILLFDIETSPLTAYTWSLWDEVRSFDKVLEDWCMLTWAAKWLGEEEIIYDSNHLHGDPLDDTPIVHSLHSLIDEADIIIAHNGNKFDIKKMNARFLAAGLTPPSPYKKIDTLAEAKKNFALTSNRLDAIGEMFGLGRKIDTGGFDLWVRYMAGDEEAGNLMVDYNMEDVLLLERVYHKLRPWMNNHPNLGVYSDEEETQCAKCGSSHIHWRGYATTQAGRYPRYQCQDCGGWGRGRFTELPINKRRTLGTNAQ